VARSAFLDLVAEGKPRHGFSFKIMTKTRAAFKLALRYCKQHEDMKTADSYTSSLKSSI
jgi:phenylalanyl-tRNA synthetase beta subunit